MHFSSNSISKNYSDKKYLFNRIHAFVILSLVSLFLFYKYVLQIFPCLITDELMRSLHLSGASLGNLAGSYYYSYLVMQLAAGVLVDRFGARKLVTLSFFICGLGALLFSYAQLYEALFLARMLMGIGVSFATIAYLKLAAAWFPKKYFALLSGLLTSAAMIGALFGEAPLRLICDYFGWHFALSLVGYFGLFAGCLFLLAVREQPRPEFRISDIHSVEESAKALNWSAISSVLKKTDNWILTAYAGLAFSPIPVFAGLWGVPFLQAAEHVTKTQAASLASLIFLGLAFGSPILGSISIWFRRKNIFICANQMVAAFCLIMVLYVHLPIWLLSTALFCFGFTTGSFMQAFTMGKEINPLFLTATVVAMINTSEPVLDAISDPLIGKILDIEWQGKIMNGAHIFSVHAYDVALSLLPAYIIIAGIMILWVKTDRAKNLT